MATVVSRPIVTHPTNPDYEAGWVFTYRKCPECKEPVNVLAEDDYSMEFECDCGVKGTVDLRSKGGTVAAHG